MDMASKLFTFTLHYMHGVSMRGVSMRGVGMRGVRMRAVGMCGVSMRGVRMRRVRMNGVTQCVMCRGCGVGDDQHPDGGRTAQG